ncbi:trypsin-like serine protease [Streptomyces doebereineriae]|uniref:Trypsin-like serine protease n=1 Tax=Streptomyces doebereineriae TaxID=3075528 RepID=A0ABU2V7E7_9ACTN|nr:trypsin-like serine protease [Streptomyces sp. DSM 41640]MDT0481492.1 trypsin-like serine protease [Streptomyces sp. DSM 41640]
MSGGAGRHRRRLRIALPVAVAAALLTTSANAATVGPEPLAPATAATAATVASTPSQAELEQRIAGAIAAEDTSGTTTRSPMSGGSVDSTVSPMIIGGTTTTITSAPWMAQLWYTDDQGTTDTSDDTGFFCGGAVVAPTKILTAAHCVKGADWAKGGAVVTGATQLPSDDGDLHGGTATAVLRQWYHPSYNADAIDNDIAVLTLAAPVKATPIRMTTSTDTASYDPATTGAKSAKVYGWGRTSSTSDDVSPTLKTATLPIKSDTTCAAAYGSWFIKGHMTCAGPPASGTDSGTTAICSGDSGGPLVVNGRIVGVVSWNVTDCVAKGAYSVFTKVSKYVGAAYPRVDDTNLNFDHKADLWMRKSSTKVGYEQDSKGTTLGARQSWGDWNGVNLVRQTDLNRDGYQDLMYRVSATGDVYWLRFLPSTGTWADPKKVFTDWRTRTRIVTPGDVTGDYKPDLLSVDSAGVLWIYPGKGDGSFATRVRVGGGWSQYNQLLGHGDFTGDGKADVLARNKSTGDLYLYKGTGKSGTGVFAARVKVRTNWSGYNAFDAVGDITGDGRADLVARTAGGTLYLYKGTGKATSEIFATRTSMGTGFQQYDIFG